MPFEKPAPRRASAFRSIASQRAASAPADRHPREGGDPVASRSPPPSGLLLFAASPANAQRRRQRIVIPAKAGIQWLREARPRQASAWVFNRKPPGCLHRHDWMRHARVGGVARPTSLPAELRMPTNAQRRCQQAAILAKARAHVFREPVARRSSIWRRKSQADPQCSLRERENRQNSGAPIPVPRHTLDLR